MLQVIKDPKEVKKGFSPGYKTYSVETCLGPSLCSFLALYLVPPSIKTNPNCQLLLPAHAQTHTNTHQHTRTLTHLHTNSRMHTFNFLIHAINLISSFLFVIYGGKNVGLIVTGIAKSDPIRDFSHWLGHARKSGSA